MPDSPAPDGRSLDITAADRDVYDVSITHASGEGTSHCVTVPPSLMADLGLADAQQPLLVRASLAYLLEHSPDAIPGRFDLDEVGKALPGYREHIVARL
jgi:hypothetical protein